MTEYLIADTTTGEVKSKIYNKKYKIMAETVPADCKIMTLKQAIRIEARYLKNGGTPY